MVKLNLEYCYRKSYRVNEIYTIEYFNSRIVSRKEQYGLTSDNR
jgi:hypothetical protein